MSKQDKVPFLNLDPTPSPPKRPRTEDRTKSVKSLIQRAPEAEDGEIVSSPELDAADIEIKIHAEMTSSGESDAGLENTPSKENTNENQPMEVIQILDTPEKIESNTPNEEFPQKEQPSSSQRVALLKEDDDVEIDHLEISAPLQKEAKKTKLKMEKNKSPKYSSPEKDRASQRKSPREDANRKRSHDSFDEKRSGRSDSESESRNRRIEKSGTDEMEDLRKRLLKKTMTSERYSRGLEKEKRREKEQERSREHQERTKTGDKQKSQSRERDRHGRIQTISESKPQSKNKDTRESSEHDRKEKKDVGIRSDSSRKERSRPHRSDDKQRKKKKRRHRSDDEKEKDDPSEEVKEKIEKIEKSPSAENPVKDSTTYDDITSDSSNHASPTQTAKSPSPSHSPSPDESASPQQSPVPSASDASLSRSPTPVRSPTPIRKRSYFPAIEGCRNVEEFTWLNRIEEGTYGVVYRAKDKRTNEVVALKRLKMEKEREGFPITSLREINTLLKAQHPNIVTVREIVVGSNMDKIYIVMDYVEHDLKALMETMTQPFLVGEVKTLMLQLLRGVRHMHDNWILHRDIKASNLLLSHKGILKIGDFGLAREYGSPLKKYTSIVVTLWYRAPELLLGAKEYSTAIDVWSVGCVFAELLTMKPLFPGKSEIDQLNRIFKELGTPNDKIWPGPPAYSEHPQVKKMNIVEHPYNILRQRFGTSLTDSGFDLMNKLLTYDPTRRLTADDALRHGYFKEAPTPVDPSMFPTWPAKSELGHKALKKKNASPKAPEGGAEFNLQGEDGGGFHMSTTRKGSAAKGLGFNLKF